MTLNTGFPTNYSNRLNVTVNGTFADRAGNTIIAAGANSDTTCTDGAPPQIKNITYSYYTRQIVILFNETVNGSSLSITLKGLNFSDQQTNHARNFTIVGLASNSTSTNTTTLTINTSQRDTISGWRVQGPLNNNLNLSFKTGLIKDRAGNSLNRTKKTIARYVNDTSRPNMTIASFIYNHNTKNLTLFFNESIDVGGLVVQDIKLHNFSNSTKLRTRNLSLVGATVDRRRNGTSVNITLTSTQQSNVSSWVNGNSAAVLYISMFVNTSIRDLGGNNIRGIRNNTAVRVVTYTKDNVRPYLQNITMTNSSYRGRGQSRSQQKLIKPVKAGAQNITVYFSEFMNTRTKISLNYTHGTNTTNVPCSWFNNTAANCSFRLATTATNGWATISIGNATDISGINAMNKNNSFQFEIDTSAPKVIRAYYIDGNFINAVNNFTGGDYVVLEFNENVSLGGMYGRGKLPTQVANFTKDAINLTIVAKDKINVSRNTTGVTPDNSTVGKFRIKLQLNSTDGTAAAKRRLTNLTIRGVYNPARKSAGDPSGADVSADNSIIRDDAGNAAVPNSTALDIADRLISFQQNVSQTFSVPYCINASLMRIAAIGKTTACSNYTDSKWSTGRSLSNVSGWLQPLIAYKCTVTGDSLEYYIYTSNQSKCSLSSIRLAQDWNLVGIDGERRVNASYWLIQGGFGLNIANPGVTQLYKNVDNTVMTQHLWNSTTRNFESVTLNPYTGVWIAATVSKTSFFGGGLY